MAAPDLQILVSFEMEVVGAGKAVTNTESIAEHLLALVMVTKYLVVILGVVKGLPIAALERLCAGDQL